MRSFRIGHVLPSTTVIGGTEHATVRIARAVAPAGFESVAFCIEGNPIASRFFVGEGLAVSSFTAVEPSIHRPLPYLRAARELARNFRHQRIDLVHCADVLSAHYTALAGRLARLPVLCHVRNRHDDISRRDRLFLCPVDRWIFVSHDTWRHFSVKVNPCNGHVVYDGIDRRGPDVHSGHSVRREFAVSDDALVIGMVARVAQQKDFLTLARAARRIVARHPRARFLIVGDVGEPGHREHFDMIRSALAELGLTETFIFTGHRRDVARLISAMDVFVLCTHFEGLPLVLLEGMAQGKPTIATAVDGIPEIITHGETGLLHRHGADEELAHLIATVLDDPELGMRLGKAGRTSVETFWTTERFGRDMVAQYGAMLGVG